MIKLNRVLVHAEHDNCTFESKDELIKLKRKVADQMGISPTRIMCDYEEIKLNETQHHAEKKD